MMKKEDEWFAFSKQAFEALGEAKPNGAIYQAVLEAFKATREQETATLRVALQDFSEPIFQERCVCYTIRNRVNGYVYVGSTTKCFTERYRKGAWWEESHSERLTSDALVYGIGNFTVNIYACADVEDMNRVEAQLQTAHRLVTYNLRRDSSNSRA